MNTTVEKKLNKNKRKWGMFLLNSFPFFIMIIATLTMIILGVGKNLFHTLSDWIQFGIIFSVLLMITFLLFKEEYKKLREYDAFVIEGVEVFSLTKIEKALQELEGELKEFYREININRIHLNSEGKLSFSVYYEPIGEKNLKEEEKRILSEIRDTLEIFQGLKIDRIILKTNRQVIINNLEIE